MSSSATSRIIRACPITEVFVALGGKPPKRGRARCFWRDGDNPYAISLNDELGCWRDFVSGNGGGVLDLIQHAHGCNRQAALLWLSAFTGIPLEAETPSERRERIRQREKLQTDLRDARRWSIAAAVLAEDALAEVSAIDPRRRELTELLVAVRGADTALVSEYRAWKKSAPKLTRALMEAGKRSDERKRGRLARFIESEGSIAA